MVVRDLFHMSDDVRVIARTVFEDRCKSEEIDGWISCYYAHLMKLKNSKIRKSDMMFFLSVISRKDMQYGNVSGFSYKAIKAGEEDLYYSIEGLNYRQYASLYVPDYTIQRYGVEVVAAEALREYGWNGYDHSVVCPESIRSEVWKALESMTHDLFLTDKEYFYRCRSQFRKAYEGKKVPQWDDARTAQGVRDNRSDVGHFVLF